MRFLEVGSRESQVRFDRILLERDIHLPGISYCPDSPTTKTVSGPPLGLKGSGVGQVSVPHSEARVQGAAPGAGCGHEAEVKRQDCGIVSLVEEDPRCYR